MSRLEERIENFNKAFELFTTMRNNFVTDKQNDSITEKYQNDIQGAPFAPAAQQ